VLIQLPAYSFTQIGQTQAAMMSHDSVRWRHVSSDDSRCRESRRREVRSTLRDSMRAKQEDILPHNRTGAVSL
jgi:hypothetical protein